MKILFCVPGSNEKTNIWNTSVETGGFLHDVWLWVQRGLSILTLTCVSQVVFVRHKYQHLLHLLQVTFTFWRETHQKSIFPERKWWEVCNLIKMILIIIKNWWATSLLEEAFVFFLSIKFNLSIIQFHFRFEHELNYGDRWHLVTSTHILILNKVKTAKSVIHWYSFLFTHHPMIMTITTYVQIMKLINHERREQWEEN